MTDRFLDEVRALHRVRREIRALDDTQREALIKHLNEVEGIDGSRDEWVFDARDAQIPPKDDEWTIWCFMGGRASGKTHALSQAVHLAVRAGVQEMSFIAPTAHDCLATNIMGESGIMRTAGRNPLPRFHRSKRQLEFPSGARVTFYSGEEPDQLRGPQCEVCFVDELARMPDAAAVFDMANFGMRLGEAAHVRRHDAAHDAVYEAVGEAAPRAGHLGHNDGQLGELARCVSEAVTGSV